MHIALHKEELCPGRNIYVHAGTLFSFVQSTVIFLKVNVPCLTFLIITIITLTVMLSCMNNTSFAFYNKKRQRRRRWYGIVVQMVVVVVSIII